MSAGRKALAPYEVSMGICYTVPPHGDARIVVLRRDGEWYTGIERRDDDGDWVHVRGSARRHVSEDSAYERATALWTTESKMGVC